MDKILYFDAAASSLKPQSVVDSEMDFLTRRYANAGRGICSRASAVDEMVAIARDSVREFIGATSPEQIIFTSGTTDGMNRIARMVPQRAIVAVSDLDHHSARLPFENEHNIIVCPLDNEYNYDTGNIPNADVFVITAMSNVLGVPQDVKKIIEAARVKNPNVITIIDAAQYVAHLPINVTDWDADFLCFSGHKIGADTGVGVMYIKNPDKWSPDKLGGGSGKMADGKWQMADGAARYEPGTLPLTQIVGLNELLKNPICHLPSAICHYLYDELSKIPQIKLLTARDAVMVSFVVDGMHVLDFGAVMGAHGVCLRVGNMCASWIHKRIGIDASIRLSPGFWNTMEQAEQVVDIIKKILK